MLALCSTFYIIKTLALCSTFYIIKTLAFSAQRFYIIKTLALCSTFYIIKTLALRTTIRELLEMLKKYDIENYIIIKIKRFSPSKILLC